MSAPASNDPSERERPSFVVLHVPHSSIVVPDDVRELLLLDAEALDHELLVMTDHFTDAMFRPASPAVAIVFPVSRLVVDPERFRDDEMEPMAERGMGAVYTRTSSGDELRGKLAPEQREALLTRFYDPHHARLTHAVARALDAHGFCFVIDCHSFPRHPLPYEGKPEAARPEICIGSDVLHTPGELLETASSLFREAGFEVVANEPFSGTIVPSVYLDEERSVFSLMIEVRRDLYMDEASGRRRHDFDAFVTRLSRILHRLIDAVQTNADVWLEDIEHPLDPDTEERCPICRRRNNPGEENCCEHFLGIWLDNELIWSNPGYEFDRAFRHAQGATEDLNTRETAAIRKRLFRSEHRVALDALIAGEKDWWQSNAFCFVEHAPRGIFGDAGPSIYQSSPESFAGVLQALEHIAEIARQVTARRPADPTTD